MNPTVYMVFFKVSPICNPPSLPPLSQRFIILPWWLKINFLLGLTQRVEGVVHQVSMVPYYKIPEATQILNR